jgi:hypothetical protein
LYQSPMPLGRDARAPKMLHSRLPGGLGVQLAASSTGLRSRKVSHSRPGGFRRAGRAPGRPSGNGAKATITHSCSLRSCGVKSPGCSSVCSGSLLLSRESRAAHDAQNVAGAYCRCGAPACWRLTAAGRGHAVGERRQRALMSTCMKRAGRVKSPSYAFASAALVVGPSS